MSNCRDFLNSFHVMNMSGAKCNCKIMTMLSTNDSGYMQHCLKSTTLIDRGMLNVYLSITLSGCSRSHVQKNVAAVLWYYLYLQNDFSVLLYCL